MTKKKKSFLIIFFTAVLIYSLGKIGVKLPEYSSEKKSIERAIEVAKREETAEDNTSEPLQDTTLMPADPDVEFLLSIDIGKLQAENPDVAGWILIPGTEISYPLLQTEDNAYYLKHTWDNQENSCGSIFYDYRSNPNDWNSVIYGHNMRNGSMFAQLCQYKNIDFSVNNNRLLILNDGKITEYSVVAAFEAKLDGVPYLFGDASEEEKDEFVNELSEKSGNRVSVSSSFVTLSTCTGWGHATRWVVVFSADNQLSVSDTIYFNKKDVTT